MKNKYTEAAFSRRAVLTRSAVATGGFAVAGLLAGCVGSTPESDAEGGSQSESKTGFIPSPAAKKKVESWSSFEVVAAFDGTYDDPRAGKRTRTLEQTPDCGDGEPVTYQGYRIKRVGGDVTNRRDIAILFVDPNLTVPTDVALELTDVEHGCQGILYGGGKGTHEEDTSKVTFSEA